LLRRSGETGEASHGRSIHEHGSFYGRHPVARRPNYGFEKQQKDAKKLKKREEKEEKKRLKREAGDGAAPPPAEGDGQS
jgi:hypothetical protein